MKNMPKRKENYAWVALLNPPDTTPALLMRTSMPWDAESSFAATAMPLFFFRARGIGFVISSCKDKKSSV